MLAVLTTHPIQYQVPLWQALAREGSVPFEVWYLSDHGARQSFDTDFQKTFSWDLDLLAGYPHRFLDPAGTRRVDRFSSLRLEQPLAGLFREKRVKALWVQGWQVLAYWQAVREARARGVEVWLRGESNDLAPPAAWWKRSPRRTLLRHLFGSVDDFLYIGSGNRRLYESFGVRPKNLHPAWYAVDNARFAAQAGALREQRDRIRRDWNIPQRAFCVLFAGKLIAKKRPFDLIEAATDVRLRARDVEVHLLFAGSGGLGAAARARCEVAFDAEAPNDDPPRPTPASRSRPRASFVGFLNQREISRAYVAADCLVLPSDHRETWGLVANEALASGLPALVSDACGCAEDLIVPLNRRWCFQKGNTGAVAEAICGVVGEPIPRERLQAHVSRFDVGACVRTVVALYRKFSAESPAQGVSAFDCMASA